MGLPFHKPTFIPLLFVFFGCAFIVNNNNTLLEQFFMQKEQEKGSFLSSSPPIHDIRLTSRGAHQTHILIYPSRDCRHGAQVCDEQTLVYIVLITSLQLLLLFSSAAVGAKFLSTTHFFDFSHTSNTAATLFRIPFQGTQLMLLCFLLFKHF
jgi:hypothetical protein